MDNEVLKNRIPAKESLKMDSKKAKKPQMEKLRRARINESLNELKSLVLDAMKKDVSRYSKMEKADILEMTVKYLRETREKSCKTASDSLTMANYRAGFNECASEVARYLMTLENVSDELRAHLLSHLSSYYGTQSEPVKWAGTRSNGLPYSTQMLRLPTKLGHTLPTFPIPTAKPSKEVSFSSSTPTVLPQQETLLRISAPSQVVLSNGMPALLVPNDGVQLLPLPTLPWQSQRSSLSDSFNWRPCIW